MDKDHRLSELLNKSLMGYQMTGTDVSDNVQDLRDAIRIALMDEQTPPSNAAVFRAIYRMTSEP